MKLELELELILIHLFELFAALSGSYFWFKTKEQAIRPFVWYLWFVVVIETLAMYPYLYGRVDNTLINWLEHSFMRRNTWIYNIYDPGTILLFWIFIKRNTHTKFSHKTINVVFWLSFSFFVLYHVISGSFFKTIIEYDMAIFTIALFAMVLMYLRELVQSDEILNFYKSHVFYICIAMMLFYICMTPLFFYNEYFSTINPDFIDFRRITLSVSNIILYSCYVFAFLFSLYHKKKLKLKKSL
ncbi:hypothetical protein [Winogradskyella sp.]|jgi:hypothetical protein|uniref:hypothetical protein n=1 Tax=Winogradskyella sp. TaxID=1883156 RepID=UPI0025DFBB61|nr:hypothetical protein [Winogradskyella sp.]MCT4629757.1 hypothetical protein [Winogradskyella sp.]